MSIVKLRKKYHALFKFHIFAAIITVIGLVYFGTAIILFANHSHYINNLARGDEPIYDILLYVGIGVFAFICFISVFATLKLNKTKKILTIKSHTFKNFN